MEAKTTNHGNYQPKPGEYVTATVGKRTAIIEITGKYEQLTDHVATVFGKKVTMGRRHGVTWTSEKVFVLDPTTIVKLPKEMLADRIADCNAKHKAFVAKHADKGYRYFETTTDPAKL